MSDSIEHNPKLTQWRLECFGHAVIEHLAGLLPGSWAFRLGEALGGLAWLCMPRRRKMILRNLRIAFAGEKDLPTLRRMVRGTFLRTGANLLSAAHTARLAPEKLGRVIDVENLGLLEQALAGGHGVVLLLSHMGNWELLSRLIHFFPKGSKAGAFYRPLNNLLLDQQVLARRQADGTRMFSKRDNPLHVASFLRDGGIVGILADQRVGVKGELVRFFGRTTRASPLPSLMARRSKSAVLALSLKTIRPGKWSARFVPLGASHSTAGCMEALQQAMEISPLDVFWFQERWKVYVHAHHSVSDWLGPQDGVEGKPLRGLLWLADAPDAWQLPGEWIHGGVVYEAVMKSGQSRPVWLPPSTVVHTTPTATDRDSLQQAIASIDATAELPVDFILAPGASRDLIKAGRREAVPVVLLK